MTKRPEPPPELADAIEFTAEFRDAMGIVEDEPPPAPVREIPSDEELAQIPEWYAINGWITAQQYLACFGYSADQPIQTIRNGKGGDSTLWKKKYKKKTK